MARYQTSTMGEYARMLHEDALHALNRERRLFDQYDRVMWEYDPEMDQSYILQKVDGTIRVLAHNLKQALDSMRAIESLADKMGVMLSPKAYEEARIIEADRFADDWAWVYKEWEVL